MSKNLKRLLSLVLSAVLVLSSFTMNASAAGRNASEGPQLIGSSVKISDIDPSVLGGRHLGKVTDTGNTAVLQHDADDIVPVAIVLNAPSTMDAGYSLNGIGKNPQAIAYRDGLKRNQTTVTQRIEAQLGAPLSVQGNLTLLVNVIAAEVRYGDINKIKLVDGVKDVQIEATYTVQDEGVNTALTTQYMTNATYAWAGGYTGAGSRIAIIDTGVEDEHEAFDGRAYEYSLMKTAFDKSMLLDEFKETLNVLTKEEILEVASQLNVTDLDVDKAYKSAKIPFGYNYYGGNYVSDNTEGSSEHGSHVAGIAAANRYVKVDGKYVESALSKGAVGVAPDAQILAMQVFSSGGGTRDATYFLALEDAIVLGCDSANLSLGSSNPGETSSEVYQEAMNKLAEEGIVVAISAGNSYAFNDYSITGALNGKVYLEDVSLDTVGSPGSYRNSLSVAAAQNVGIIGLPLIFGDDYSVWYNEALEDSQTHTPYGNPAIKTIAGTYEYVYLDSVGTDEEFEAIADLVEGKVAICNRGETSFYQKANAAFNAGAVAVIVANNTTGVILMNLTGYTGNIPAVTITQAQAQYVKSISATEERDGLTLYTGTVQITDEDSVSIQYNGSDETDITDFSSWGVPGALILKPEITAPGGDIWSVNGYTTDSYENMSGTSMAAPHVAGMAAVVAQYVKENEARFEGIGQRALVTSLLMSTAVPIKRDGNYVSVLQQGAGLGNVLKAISALSYITMEPNATESYADGKVKAEFGQDANRTGVYQYSFTIRNTSDQDLTYLLTTDLFTQDIEDDGLFGFPTISKNTVALDAIVTYGWDRDVDGNEENDLPDVQAILDFLTGKLTEDEIRGYVADLDEDGQITSYDAYLLLKWLDEQGKLGDTEICVPAGQAVTVDVSIALKDTDELSENYPAGAYVEGYTILSCVTTSDDGAALDTEHSIPLLGFFGSWTDASMFDKLGIIDNYYFDGSNGFQFPYTINILSDDINTNGLILSKDGEQRALIGNPYVIEDEAPYDRFAVSADTILKNIRYTLIRNAGAMAYVIWKIDEDGNETGILTYGDLGGDSAAYYHVNEGKWMNIEPHAAGMNLPVGDLGLKEGDWFKVSLYALPEYYGILFNGPDAPNAGDIPAEAILTLLLGYSDVSFAALGDGVSMEFSMRVDSITPEMAMELSEDEKVLTVTAKDNRYVAGILVMDVTGDQVFYAEAPEQDEEGEEVEMKIDLEALGIAGEDFIVLAGDYAGNESAKLVAHGDTVRVKKEIYQLTDTLEAGGEYLISNANAAGTGTFLTSPAADDYTDSANVSILASDDYGVYVPIEDAPAAGAYLVYEGDAGFKFQCTDNSTWIGYNDTGEPYVAWANSGYADEFIYSDNQLLFADYPSLGMYYLEGYFYFYLPGPVYLYEKTAVYEEVPISALVSVTIAPGDVVLPLGTSTQLFATVLPIFLGDRTVTWSSSDPDIASVDENGNVKGHAAGTAQIIATANAEENPEAFGAVNVLVVEPTPMEGITVNAQISAEGTPYFGTLDLGDLNNGSFAFTYAPADLVGGGQSGEYLYAYSRSYDFYKIGLNGYNANVQFKLNATYAPIDVSNFVPFTYTVSETVTGEDGEEQTVETSYPVEYDLVGITEGGLFEMIIASGSLSYFDLSGSIRPLAVAFAGYITDEKTGVTDFYYYLLGADGHLYLIWIAPDGVEDGDVSLTLGGMDCGPLDGPMYGEDLTAYSMTHLGGQTDDESLVIVNNANKTVWVTEVLADDEGIPYTETRYIGLLEDVTNLSMLYNEDYDAARMDSVLRDMKAAAVPVIRVQSQTASAAAQGLEAIPMPEGLEARTFAKQPAGQLNAVKAGTQRGANRILRSDDPAEVLTDKEETIGTAVLTLGQNGYLEVTYDAELLTYKGYESDAEYISVNEEDGVIRIAYARLEEEEGTLTLKFAVTCEDSDVQVLTIEDGEDLDAALEEEITVEGTGHAWGEPEWTWTGNFEDGYTAASAVFVCGNDESHVFTAEAELTVEETSRKSTLYTAVVTGPDGETYTDVKEVFGNGKFEVDVSSETNDGSSTTVKGIVWPDYSAILILPNGKVNAGNVSVLVRMTDVASLGVSGTREYQRTVNTGLTVEKLLYEALATLFGDDEALFAFGGSTLNVKIIDGLTDDVAETVYTLEGSAFDGEEGSIKYIEASTDEEATRAAWQLLVRDDHIKASTKSVDDSYIVIKNGSSLQIGTEILSFEGEDDLLIDNLGDLSALVQAIRDAVKLETADEAALTFTLVAGTKLALGNSEAELLKDVKVTVEGVDASGLTVLSTLRDAESTADLVKGLFAALNTAAGLLDGAEADVTIEFAHTHTWGEPEWTWTETEDGFAAEAAFTCEENPDHTETVEAEVTAERQVITEDGITRVATVYTATVEGPDGETYTDTKEVADDVYVISNSADFTAKLMMNYYMYFPQELLADEGLKVVITFDGVTSEYLVKDVTPTQKAGEDFLRYKFTQEVFARQMHDKILLEVFDGEGNRVAFYVKRNHADADLGYRTESGYSFAIIDYLKLVQVSGSEKMKELAYAAEQYGIAAQYEFDYETEGLDAVSDEVTAVTQEDLEAYAPVESGTLPAALSKANTNSVFFKADNTLRQFFILKSGESIDGLTITVKPEGSAAEDAVLEQYSEVRYYVDIPDISPRRMADTYTFVTTDGTDTYTYVISVMGYVYKIIGSSSSETMVNLAKAAYLYHKAAKAYFD